MTLLALLVAAGMAGTARADLPTAPNFGPSVWTDKADYAPGETVQLSGADWQPGETVHIRVNDDAGSTWSRDVDVTADQAGAIADSFALPDWFVADYSVTATGASGLTATGSFTDGNVQVAVAGGAATITETLYTSTETCTGAVKNNYPMDKSIPPTDGVGVGSSQSLRLDAPATANGGQPFTNWSQPAGGTLVFSAIAGTNGRSICVVGFSGNGSKDITANYATNSVPSVATNNASVSVNEGQTATNTGTYSDANSGDNVTITASSGTITKTGTNSGTWSWSLGTTDGPDQSGTITIIANDGNGGITTTNFTLNVANVAPTVTLAAGNPTSVNEGATQQTYSYTISDPGADTVTAVTTGCGANGVKVPGSDTNTNTSGSFKCTFADGPNSSVVTASATDSDNLAGTAATQTVTVNNVAPTVTLTGPATANEGDTKTYNFTVADPGQDTFVVDAGYPDCDAGATNNGTYVAGSLAVNASGGSFQCVFSDGPSTANVKMGVRDSDGAADSSTQSVQIVAVANVNPTVTAPANQNANEGASASINLGSFTDPGPDSPWAVDVDWGDGSSHSTFTMAATGSLGSLSHTYADGPATRTVSVKVTDKNTGSDTKTFTVAVANVAPTVVLAGGNDLSVSEGPAQHIYSYTINDPGQDTVQSVSTSCGPNGSKVVGSDSNTNSSGSFQCTFPDGPASSTVSARATDDDGAQGAADSQTVAVANVAPTVTLSAANDLSVAEGSAQHTYNYSVSDPGVDTVQAVATSCGANGSKVAGSDSHDNSSGSFQCTFPDGDATSVVSVSATDSDGAAGNLATQSVTVNNVAPTATVTGPATADEGTTKTYSFSVTDPGNDTFAVDAGYPDCDAGATNNGTYVAGSLSVTASGGSFQCSFPDGPSTANVKVKVLDSDGASTTASESVQVVAVANVNPTVTAPGNQSANEGASASLNLGSFSDPGPDSPWAVDVDWGDGSTHSSFTMAATGSLGSLSHAYANGPATRTVSVTVTDKNNGSDTKTFTVAVANVAPTVVLAGGNDLSVSEGSAEHTYSYTISDPGHDPVQSVATSCGDNGTKVAGSDSNTNSSGSFKCTFPDGDATSVVSARATDSDGGQGAADSQTVSVANVAPTVTLTGDSSVDEGTTHTYSFTVTDPGADTFVASSGYPDCDFGGANGALVAGSYAPTPSGGSFKCSFPDGPSTANVKMRVADSDGASGADSESVQVVAVANVNPTVTAPANQTANEGSAKSIDLGSFSDPGPDSPWAVDVDWGDGSAHSTFNVTAPGSLGSLSHTYADGPATQTVTVKVTDKNTGSDTKTFTVDVANIAPKVTLSSTNDLSANEGSTHTYSYSIYDPGQDTVQSVSTSCGANGTKVAGSDTNTATSGSFQCTFPDGPASSDVTASATDSDGDTGAPNSQTVAVANVAPTVHLTGASSVDEGSTRTYTFTVSDPGQDTFTAAGGAPDCDAGATDNGTVVPGSYTQDPSGGSFKCSFPDGPSTAQVKMQVADSDGASGADSESVQVVDVANVAPTVTPPATQSAPEGTAKSIDLGSFSDPGPDSPWAVDVDWGDGSAHTAFNAASTGSLGTQGHTYANGPATQTVTVKVTDKNNGSDTKTFTVNVTNVAPKVTLSTANDRSVDEGTTHTYSYSISDPGQDTVQSVQPNCGGRGTLVAGSSTNDNTSGSFKCSFADGLSPATASTVSVSAKDSDGDTGTADTQSVTVNNVAPTVTAAANQTATEGSSQSFTLGSFGDPGADSPWNVSVSWGDGTAAQSLANQTSTGSLGSASHTYADNGSYTVRVTVTDKDGGADTKSFTVAVANVKPTITSFSGTDYLAGANAFISGGTVASTFTTRFTDPGADSWTGDFTYQDGSPLTASTSPFVTGQQVSHTFASSGCKSASVKVTDDDGGYDTASTTIKIGTGAFQPPMTNQPVTDKLKNGQVLPVKVHVNDCSGAAATTLAPAIRLLKGDLTPQNDDATTTITPPSVSAADTTGVMRSSGGGDYIYNMQVNLASLNTDYTVVVYPYGTGSPVELGHVIQATK